MLDTMCRRMYASITENKEQYPPQWRSKGILSVDRLFHYRAQSILPQNAWHWPFEAGRALLLVTAAPSATANRRYLLAENLESCMVSTTCCS